MKTKFTVFENKEDYSLRGMQRKPQSMVVNKPLYGLTLVRILAGLTITEAAKRLGVTAGSVSAAEARATAQTPQKALTTLKAFGFSRPHPRDPADVLLNKMALQACLMYPELDWFMAMRLVLRHNPDIVELLLRPRPGVDEKYEKAKISTSVSNSTPIPKKKITKPAAWPLSEEEYKVKNAATGKKIQKARQANYYKKCIEHRAKEKEAKKQGKVFTEPPPWHDKGGRKPKARLVKRVDAPAPTPTCPRDTFGAPTASFICNRCKIKKACHEAIL